LLSVSFWSDDFGFRHPARAEEETQVPGAALTAAKRPHQQRKQEYPLEQARAVGTQHIFAAA